MTPAVSFDAVTIRLPTPDGGALTVATNLSLDIAEGHFVAIVGPSGCGKSTLLNLAAGLLFAPEGKVRIFGDELGGINQHAAYLFQQDALLPWRTIIDNVLLSPLIRGRSHAEAEPEARHWLQRALVVHPELLLMDEPFSALDVQTRQIMETELLGLWAETRKTVLFVTHDLEEAIALADEVVVLSARPARIKGVYPVDLPRPRDVAEIRMIPEFNTLYNKFWADLRVEVGAAAHG